MHPAPLELYGDRNRVAFVTGAARGIGRAIALRLATDGLDVAVNDKDDSALENTRAEVERLGTRCVALVGDVSDEGRVEEMVNEVVRALGYLDVMVRFGRVIFVSKPYSLMLGRERGNRS
jgi:meso-butanediol dehydrogenase/(S,S)-butanediol dehydrogenase/diacetyl reductase